MPNSQFAFFTHPLLAWTVLLCASSSAQDDTNSLILRNPDSAPLPARITRIDGDWRLGLETGEQEISVPLTDVVRWGGYRDTFRQTEVLLADGSLLVAEVIRVLEDRLAVDGLICGYLELPLAKIVGIVFDAPADARQRDRLRDRIRNQIGVADQLWLTSGDTLSGVLKAVREADIEDSDAAPRLVFQTAGRDLALSVDGVVALRFNPALTAKPSLDKERVWLGFEDGSLLVTSTIDPQAVFTRITLLCGLALEVDPKLLADQLTLIQPFGHGVLYVSDLAAASYKHIPFLDLSWDLARDRNVLGGRLRSRGVVYAKGLGVHSTARVAYRLDRSFRQLAGELALDDAAKQAGSVRFRVYLNDGQGTWRQAYQSPVIRGGDEPVPMTVDVTDARAIVLIVDFAAGGDALDYANWLNLRLLP